MMARFATLVLEKRPSLLWGHAHSLYLLARFWESRSYPQPPLKGVLSTAMVLHAHEREKIQEIFGVPVFDRYGCEEVSLIGSECEAHEGLHVNSDSLFVEIDQRDAEAAGHVLVTDLRNRGMPFIRYEVGDRGLWSDQPCSCGRTYPLLQGIMGRVADYLVTPDGDLVSGISLTENFATLIAGVRQVQIVQDELTHLLIRVVPEPEFEATGPQATADLVRERFGPEMRFDIELVQRIPQEATGKYRFTICRVRPPNEPV
jgi:phenylacetate-CoA ligase